MDPYRQPSDETPLAPGYGSVDAAAYGVDQFADQLASDPTDATAISSIWEMIRSVRDTLQTCRASVDQAVRESADAASSLMAADTKSFNRQVKKIDGMVFGVMDAQRDNLAAAGVNAYIPHEARERVLADKSGAMLRNIMSGPMSLQGAVTQTGTDALAGAAGPSGGYDPDLPPPPPPRVMIDYGGVPMLPPTLPGDTPPHTVNGVYVGSSDPNSAEYIEYMRWQSTHTAQPAPQPFSPPTAPPPPQMVSGGGTPPPGTTESWVPDRNHPFGGTYTTVTSAVPPVTTPTTTDVTPTVGTTAYDRPVPIPPLPGETPVPPAAPPPTGVPPVPMWPQPPPVSPMVPVPVPGIPPVPLPGPSPIPTVPVVPPMVPPVAPPIPGVPPPPPPPPGTTNTQCVPCPAPVVNVTVTPAPVTVQLIPGTTPTSPPPTVPGAPPAPMPMPPGQPAPAPPAPGTPPTSPPFVPPPVPPPPGVPPTSPPTAPPTVPGATPTTPPTAPTSPPPPPPPPPSPMQTGGVIRWTDTVRCSDAASQEKSLLTVGVPVGAGTPTGGQTEAPKTTWQVIGGAIETAILPLGTTAAIAGVVTDIKVGSAVSDIARSSWSPANVKNPQAVFLYGSRIAVAEMAARKIGFPSDYVSQGDRYSLQYMCPVMLPDQTNVDILYLQGRITSDDWHCLTRAQGNIEDLAQKVMESREEKPNLQDVIRLYLRGKIKTRQELNERSRGLSVLDQAYLDEWIELAQSIPTVSDMVSWMKRDAFDAAVVKKYQYDAEYAEKFTNNKRAQELARAGGIGDDVMRYSWYAHWNIPSDTQLFEMLHRLRPDSAAQKLWQLQKKTIEENKLEQKVPSQPPTVTNADVVEALKINDLAPAWVDRLIAVSYHTVTNTDARRMFGAGYINVDELASRFQDTGYTSEDAATLAKFEETIRNRMVANQAGVWAPRKVVSAYKDALIDRKTADDKLKDFTPDDKIRKKMLDGAELEADIATRKRMVDGIRRKFLYGEIANDQLQNALTAVGIRGDQAARLSNNIQAEKLARRKEPRVQMICQWFNHGFIDFANYKFRLENLGYSPEDSDKIASTCRADDNRRRQREAAAAAEKAANQARRDALEAMRQTKATLKDMEKQQKEAEKQLEKIQKQIADAEKHAAKSS